MVALLALRILTNYISFTLSIRVVHEAVHWYRTAINAEERLEISCDTSAPGLGGLGKKRADDKKHPLEGEGKGREGDIAPCSKDLFITNIDHESDSNPELTFEDATGEQVKEKFCHLVRKIAFQNM